MTVELFETIMKECPQKKVVSLCKKLIKKCSFKSGADCENLCHLMYWLYIYDRSDLALNCVALTHNIPFEKNFNTWTFIHFMWGLEIRILRGQKNEPEAQKIIETMNVHDFTLGKVDTPEQFPKKVEKRRGRQTYEDTIRQEKIERSDNTKSANAWRFIGLLGMITYTETGFYPILNERKNDMEAKINEYINALLVG